jgi:putative transposase
MERLKHYDNLGTARFITFSCHRRMSLFRETDSFYLFLQSLDTIRRKYQFQLSGYVIMPNHVHLVIYPEAELALGRVIGELKAHSAFRIINQWKSIHEEILRELEVTRNKKSIYAF